MIDTQTLRTVALSYDIAFGKPGVPANTRRGDIVRKAANEIDKLRELCKSKDDEIERLRNYNKLLILGHDFQCNSRDGEACDCGLKDSKGEQNGTDDCKLVYRNDLHDLGSLEQLQLLQKESKHVS